MFYAFLADVIIAVHLAYVGFAIGGQLLIFVGVLARWDWIRNVYFRIVHMTMILFVAFEAAIGMQCPLTTWENDLRAAAGQHTNEDVGFIGRMLDSVLFYEAGSEVYLTIGYYGFAAMVLFSLAIAPPRWRRRVATVPAKPVEERVSATNNP